jgi:hypothetical protein
MSDKGSYALVRSYDKFTTANVLRSKLYGKNVSSADGGDLISKLAVQQTMVHRGLNDSGHEASGLKGIQCERNVRFELY